MHPFSKAVVKSHSKKYEGNITIPTQNRGKNAKILIFMILCVYIFVYNFVFERIIQLSI